MYVLLTAACCIWATPWPASAQPQPQGDPLPSADSGTDLGPPAAKDVMAAYRYADARLHGREPGPPPVMARASGVELTVRINRTPVARGRSWAGPEALEAAVTSLLAELQQTLPAGRDVVEEDLRASLVASATLSLEVAGPLIPMSWQTFDEVNEQVLPGLEGVCVRRGERVEGMFPLWIMGAGLDPSRALQSCVAGVTQDAAAALPGVATAEAGAAARKHNLTYYRFATTQIASLREKQEPVFLTRGSRVVDRAEVTLPAMQALADRLAEHLSLRVSPDTVVGEYNLMSGSGRPAGADEEALVAYALARFGAWRGDVPAGRSARAAASSIVESLLRERPESAVAAAPGGLATKTPRPSAWGRPAAEALCLLALRDLADAPFALSVTPQRVKRLDEAVAGRFGVSGWAPTVPAPQRGLIALALAARAQDAQASGAPGASALEDAARAAVRDVYRQTPPASLVAHMPWLGRAELMLAGEGSVPAAEALREMREQCWKVQIRDDTPDATGLEGGLAFRGAGGRWPSWHSLRPLAFLASMLADPRLTDDAAVLPELSRLTASMRFVRQLAADEAVTAMAVEPERAAWGLRAAPWEASQPAEASAVGLLAVQECIAAIEGAGKRLETRRNAPKP